MEITKLSTKGQIVIPEIIRRDIDVGTSFTVIKQNDLIILKKVKEMTEQELEEMKELDKIWEEIDQGKGVSLSTEDFLKEMDSW